MRPQVAGVDFSMQSSPSLITVNSVKVRNSSAACSPTLGQLAIQTTSPLDFWLLLLKMVYLARIVSQA